MIPVTNDYLECAKNSVRQVDVRIAIDTVNLTSDDIKSVKFRAEAEKHIGGIEYKVADIVVEKEKLEHLIDEELESIIYFGFNISGVTEYANVGNFITSTWKANPDKKTIAIELLGKSNKVIEGALPDIKFITNTTTASFTSLLVENAQYKGLNGNLKYAYYNDTDKKKIVDSLSKAMNAILSVNDVPVFKRYPSTDIVDTLPHSTIYDFVGGSDGIRAYKEVNIHVSQPYQGEFKEISKLDEVEIPEETDRYVVGEIVFDKPVQIAQVIIGSSQNIALDGFNITNKKAVFYINNSGQKENISIHLLGHEFDFAKMTNNTKDDTKIKTLDYQNEYIQSQNIINSINTAYLTERQFGLNYTGIPAYEVGDVIEIEDIGRVAISLINLEYSGGLKGRLEGVIL